MELQNSLRTVQSAIEIHRWMSLPQIAIIPMRHLRFCLLTFALTMIAVASPNEAFARGGRGIPIPIVLTFGDSIKHQGNLPEKYSAEIRQAIGSTPSVGFHHSSFGVFWLDLWTWDGQYCLYDGNKYWLMSESQASELLDTPESQLRRPFFYTFPPGLVGLAALGAGCVVYRRIDLQRKRRQYESDAALFHQASSDSRYHEAVRLYADQQSDDSMALRTSAEALQQRFAFAVEYLESHGIPKTDAERGLYLLLTTIAKQQQSDEEFRRLCPGLVNDSQEPSAGHSMS